MFVIARNEPKTNTKEYWDGGMFKPSPFRARLYHNEADAKAASGLLGGLLGWVVEQAPPEVMVPR